MTAALLTHNNLIRKAKWTNFGFTVEQEGGECEKGGFTVEQEVGECEEGGFTVEQEGGFRDPSSEVQKAVRGFRNFRSPSEHIPIPAPLYAQTRIR